MNDYNVVFVARNNLLFILFFHHVHSRLYGCGEPLSCVPILYYVPMAFLKTYITYKHI